MGTALAYVMRSQQQLRWRQQGLEKQRTEFNPRNITLGCGYQHRANASQIVSKNIPASQAHVKAPYSRPFILTEFVTNVQSLPIFTEPCQEIWFKMRNSG